MGARSCFFRVSPTQWECSPTLPWEDDWDEQRLETSPLRGRVSPALLECSSTEEQEASSVPTTARMRAASSAGCSTPGGSARSAGRGERLSVPQDSSLPTREVVRLALGMRQQLLEASPLQGRVPPALLEASPLHGRVPPALLECSSPVARPVCRLALTR